MRFPDSDETDTDSAAPAWAAVHIPVELNRSFAFVHNFSSILLINIQSVILDTPSMFDRLAGVVTGSGSCATARHAFVLAYRGDAV